MPDVYFEVKIQKAKSETPAVEIYPIRTTNGMREWHYTFVIFSVEIRSEIINGPHLTSPSPHVSTSVQHLRINSRLKS